MSAREALSKGFTDVWKTFADVDSRFWIGNLAVFLVVSFFFHLRARETPRSFFANLVRTYTSRSSRVDYKLALTNIFLLALVGTLFYDYTATGRQLQAALFARIDGIGSRPLFAPSLAGRIAFACAQAVIMDLAFFLWHYASHRVPLFWEFHKLHHSAETLTPITLLRGDPHTLVLFMLVTNCAQVLNTAAFYFLFREIPSALSVFGAPAVLLSLYMLKDHFCHSHLRLSYGKLDYVFLSPAQHQAHHSYLPAHRDKNFGFFFSWTDLLFGTFYRPLAEEYFAIGLDGVEEKHINSLSLVGLLLYPLASITRRWKTPQIFSMSDAGELPKDGV